MNKEGKTEKPLLAQDVLKKIQVRDGLLKKEEDIIEKKEDDLTI